MADPIQFVVAEGEHGQRLDLYLSRHLDYSRQVIQRCIKAGTVTVNGAAPRQRQAVQAGQRIILTPPEPVADSATPQPQPMPLNILFEDEAMLVLDKPPGLPVHPGAGHVNALLAHDPTFAEFADKERPGIVHRLDLDTSGVLLVAKSEGDCVRIANCFRRREVRKYYQALVSGVLRAPVGHVDAPIARHPVMRKQMCVQDGGREAISDFKVLEQGPAHARLRLRIATGRTHQIRVHLTHIGHPVMGDKVYGRSRSRPADFPRQMLHAWQIALPHPRSGHPMEFVAPIPADFASAWERLKS
jgi:23S rRNA pseudouridine1911/1915/1917 synthase